MMSIPLGRILGSHSTVGAFEYASAQPNPTPTPTPTPTPSPTPTPLPPDEGQPGNSPSGSNAITGFFKPVSGEKWPVGKILNEDRGSVDIYDRLGGILVKSFPDANSSTTWDGRNEKGEYVSAGTYIVKYPKNSKKVVVVK